MRASIFIFAAAVLLASVQTEASADGIALVVSGTATLHDRELAASTIESILRDAGLSSAKPNLAAKDVAAIERCVTELRAWSCIAPVVRGRGLQQVALVSLAASTEPDGGPMVVITEQIIVASLDVAISAQRFCARCTKDSLIKATTELTRALLQEMTVRSGRTVVTINSTPRGARITFDGDSAGATDRSFNTFPGTHTVVLDLDGYRQESRSIEAVLDKTSELSVTMSPLPGPGDGHDNSGVVQTQPAAPLAPKLAIAAGALAVVAGVVVLAFDEDPENKPIGTPQPRTYRDTTAPGIAVVVGGAVVGVGGYFWFRHSRRSITPTIAPLPGGAAVGMSKTF